MMPDLQSATASDLPAVCALLATSDLPTEGLHEHLDTILVTRIDGEVVGCVALEIYGDTALLRSVAVAAAHQGRGLGRALVQAALQLARRRRVSTLYLLTTTAESFFARWFRFRAIRRSEVPVSVRQSVEFRGACSANARAMRFDLEETAIPATVIFACVHGAGRSQMSAAFFNALADPGRARAIAAGTQPGPRVHPEVVAAMHEVGMDLSGARPQQLTEELVRDATLLVTMGCGETCPFVPRLRQEDWNLPDPKGRSPEDVRAIRDDIRRHVAELVDANGWATC
jgi:arsenate reductase (thioredoxin)